MPVIIPPPLLDVPAIVRAAAHSPGNQIQVQRPATPPPHLQRPDGTIQGPTVVGPPPLVPPLSGPASRPTPIERPSGTSQDPTVVGPVPLVPPPVFRK
jgi:hypothetical protein